MVCPTKTQIHYTPKYKWRFAILWCDDSQRIGTFANFGLFFPMVCLIFVFG